MSIESVMRAVEAAGFAMASDDSDVERTGFTLALPRPVSNPTPKDVLKSSLAPPEEHPSMWSRAGLTSLLPVWHAKAPA
jgi:hypothetical protein